MSVDICPRCSRPWDDHTVREAREHHPTNDLNLPFESLEENPIKMALGNLGDLSSSVVVRPFTLELGGAGGKSCGLGFTFMALDGLQVTASVALVLDSNRMASLKKLLVESIDTARRAALDL